MQLKYSSTLKGSMIIQLQVLDQHVVSVCYLVNYNMQAPGGRPRGHWPPHTSPFPVACTLKTCWNLEPSHLQGIRTEGRRMRCHVSSVLIDSKSRSGSGRDGKSRFVHAPNGQLVCLGVLGLWRGRKEKKERELISCYFRQVGR